MQVFTILFIGAFFGAVYCELDCYIEKANKCNQKIFESATEYDFCSLQPNVIRCLKEAASGCGKTFIPQIEKVASIVLEMCREGSDLNQEMKKHKDCLMTKTLTDVSCYKDIIDLSKVTPTPESMLEVQKKTCENLDKITNCVLDQSRKTCGDDAGKFLEIIYKPSMELQRGICEEVVSSVRLIRTTSKNLESLQLPVCYGPLEFML